MTNGYSKVGKLLVEEGAISQNQLDEALAEAGKTGQPLGKVLENKDLLNTGVYNTFYSLATSTALVHLDMVPIDKDALSLVPEDVVRTLQVIPYGVEEGILYVAMDNPRDSKVIERLEGISRKKVKPRIPSLGYVGDYFNRFY